MTPLSFDGFFDRPGYHSAKLQSPQTRTNSLWRTSTEYTVVVKFLDACCNPPRSSTAAIFFVDCFRFIMVKYFRAASLMLRPKNSSDAISALITARALFPARRET